MHDADLLMTIAAGLGVALVFGYATQRLGLSPIVGYLIAGIVVGPNTPGYEANADIANQFAELGVILLMFGVGLHFDVKELWRVRDLCVPGAIFQCFTTFSLGFASARFFGWDWSSSIIFAVAIAFSSTVVVTRILADANELQTHVGNIAIGWLIVQDVLAVLAMVLLPNLSGSEADGPTNVVWIAVVALAKIGVVVLAITWVGGRVIPSILQHVAATKSRELFTLAVLVLVLGIALASSKMFGISMALGAFLAGVVVGQSEFSLRAAIDALPMRDAFAVLFFVSIGMLFDPVVLTQSKGILIATAFIVLLGTPLACIFFLLAMGQPLRMSLRVGLSLSQIGEFSFIVANLGRQQELLPVDAMHVLVTVSIVTIALAPMMQWMAVAGSVGSKESASPFAGDPTSSLFDAVSRTDGIGYRDARCPSPRDHCWLRSGRSNARAAFVGEWNCSYDYRNEPRQSGSHSTIGLPRSARRCHPSGDIEACRN